jgi:Amt family ammonium transporter
VPNKGDTAWMMTSTILVLLMTIPGLALFYGGLVRSKNMLSVLMQVFYHRLHRQPDLGDLRLQPRLHRRQPQRLRRRLLQGLPAPASTTDSTAATFSVGVVIPEYVYIASR